MVGASRTGKFGLPGGAVDDLPSTTRALMRSASTAAPVLTLVLVRAVSAANLVEYVPPYKPVDIIFLLQDEKAKRALNIVRYQEAGIKAILASWPLAQHFESGEPGAQPVYSRESPSGDDGLLEGRRQGTGFTRGESRVPEHPGVLAGRVGVTGGGRRQHHQAERGGHWG